MNMKLTRISIATLNKMRSIIAGNTDLILWMPPQAPPLDNRRLNDRGLDGNFAYSLFYSW